MGSNPSLLPHSEAAKFLDVTFKHLNVMVRRGTILPAVHGKKVRDNLYKIEDLNAILELRMRNMDLPTVANMALQAHCLSRSLSYKLDRLCQFLGVENNRLGYHEDDVHNLYVKTQYFLKEDLSDIQIGALMEWASTFNAIDEAYLRIVENYTLNHDPWQPFLELANRIMASRKCEDEDNNTKFGFACLEASRKHLRHVAYFYARNKYGKRGADAAFDENVDDEIIGNLYPTTVGPN